MGTLQYKVDTVTQMSFKHNSYFSLVLCHTQLLTQIQQQRSSGSSEILIWLISRLLSVFYIMPFGHTELENTLAIYPIQGKQDFLVWLNSVLCLASVWSTMCRGRHWLVLIACSKSNTSPAVNMTVAASYLGTGQLALSTQFVLKWTVLPQGQKTPSIQERQCRSGMGGASNGLNDPARNLA